MSYIVIVEHQSWRAFELVRVASAAGHEVAFVTSDLPWYLKGRPAEETDLVLADHVREVPDTADPERLWEALQPLVAARRPDVVLSVSEKHTLAVSRVAQRLGIRHTSLHALRLLGDKYVCRQRLAEAGLPPVRCRLATDLPGAVEAAEQLGYPVVVKPVDGSGSVNVSVATAPEEVRFCAGPILGQRSYGRSTVAQRKVLVEEFLTGELVSCETFSAGGEHLVLGITDRDVTPLPHQVELGGCFPVPHPQADDIDATCRAALDAVGFDFGAAHTEIMLTPDGPRVIEINGRLAGGLMPYVQSAALQRNVYRDLIDLFLHGSLPPVRPTGRIACIKALTADRPGELRAVEASALRTTDGVVDYEIWQATGTQVRPPQHNRDRYGSVITLADTAEDARRLAADVIATTRLVIAGTLA
ncbi:ATP-grasp domain-containing protein [Streptomyces sp. NPDC054765]